MIMGLVLGILGLIGAILLYLWQRRSSRSRVSLYPSVCFYDGSGERYITDRFAGGEYDPPLLNPPFPNIHNILQTKSKHLRLPILGI
jgi:hypothetical protein